MMLADILTVSAILAGAVEERGAGRGCEGQQQAACPGGGHLPQRGSVVRPASLQVGCPCCPSFTSNCEQHTQMFT